MMGKGRGRVEEPFSSVLGRPHSCTDGKTNSSLDFMIEDNDKCCSFSTPFKSSMEINRMNGHTQSILSNLQLTFLKMP